MPTGTANELNLARVREEFLPAPDGSIYLNTGSCGRKPQTVLAALDASWRKLNLNPTRYTFLEAEPWDVARQAASELLDCQKESLLLTQATTQGLQLLMHSFLLKEGDVLVTTDHEHGSVKTIARFLEETRGIVVRRLAVDPFAGSEALCRGLLNLVDEKTRLVEVSEVDCYTGWRPDLTLLVDELNRTTVPLLVDGAHSPGQMETRPSRYPLWVGSGHKWLGGPNSTGFAYVAPHLIPQLQPVTLADKFYEFKKDQLARFETHGTTDVVRLYALAAACKLHLEFGADKVFERQMQLVKTLRELLAAYPNAQIRTPDIRNESTGMLTVTWPADKVKVEDLRDSLWTKHKIWIQPDFIYGQSGHGIRVACHAATTEEELKRLCEVLSEFVS